MNFNRACIIIVVVGFLVLMGVRFATADTKIVRNIEYGRAGGQSLLLDIYQPDVSAAHTSPAIILVHGGAWEEGSKEEFADLAKVLAKGSFVAVSINYRLMTDNGNRWPAQIDDVQRAVRWVRAHAGTYGIDPSRIGAMGASAGGHLVSLLGTIDTLHNTDPALAGFSSRVSAVVNLSGPTDLTVPFTDDPGFLPSAKDLLARLFTGPLAGAMAREASPLYHIDSSSAAFLIMHGTVDPIVSIRQSERFADALKKAGRDARLIAFEGEGHGYEKTADIARVMYETITFFKTRLASK